MGRHRLLLALIPTALQLTVVSANYWSQWTRWSECSRTCDGGATYQTRKCIRSRVFNFGCKGDGIKYSTCNNKQCPSGVPDFRSEQCAAYNDAPYGGRHFRWLSYHDPKNPCALSCLAEGTNMVEILAPKVLDGTRCNTYSLDMCINGKCWKVGCDKVLASRAAIDACGVCDGNNTCRGPPRPEVGDRYRWVETGFGPCSVSCGVGVKLRGLMCSDVHRRKMMVDSTFCKNIIRPTQTQRKCQTIPCPAEWRVGPWQNCTRDCGRGVSWRVVTCVKTFEDGTQQWMRDSHCNSLRPSSRKSCNTHLCPTWYAGQWSICSVSCGAGFQHREVFCRHVGERYCRKQDKPRMAKNCTTGIPCYTFNDRRYSETGVTGNIQERMVGEFTASEPAVQDEALRKEDMRTPRFVVSEWDACSTSCGEGVRFRFVRCQVYLMHLDYFADLPDTDCEDEKPSDTETCFVEPCYDNYEYMAVGMTECSKSCLGGIQETIIKCTHKLNSSVVADEFCLEAPHIQVERTICNVKPCPQGWRVSDYGACSASCGGGTRTREVKCIQEYAQGPDNILNLPDFMCSGLTPERRGRCNTHDCPADWRVGDWSQCSVTCGMGSRSRLAYCQRRRDNDVTVNVSNSQCDPQSKPETEKFCELDKCPEPMIKTTTATFFQLKKLPKAKVVVGMDVFVLPGTSVIAKCPNVGLDRQKVVWFHNENRIKKKVKRIKVSKSGTLRIRHSRPGKDNGFYTCRIGGLYANFSLEFSSSFDVLQADITREKYLTGNVSIDNDVMGGLFFHVDPSDRRAKPLRTVSTDWGLCSVTCGGGLQTRNMTCEIITDTYYIVLPMDVCSSQLPDKPLMIRSCNTNPCVHWYVGNWSECLEQECVRDQFSVQRRSVYCAIEFNNTAIDEDLCKSIGFPPDSIRDCSNPNCTAAWSTSRWSKCISECDEKGARTRMLSCIWTQTGALAPKGSCDHLVQPRTVRSCKGVPCSSIGNSSLCEDESDYCSTVGLMKMCHYSNFQRRCCRTCNPEYGDENETDDET